MSYANIEGVLITSQSMAAAFTTAALEARNHDIGFFQANWTGSDSGTASMSLQGSSNAAGPWDTYSTSSTLLATVGTGSASMEKEKLGPAYVRVSFTPNANTTGTVTIKYILKSSK